MCVCVCLCVRIANFKETQAYIYFQNKRKSEDWSNKCVLLTVFLIVFNTVNNLYLKIHGISCEYDVLVTADCWNCFIVAVKCFEHFYIF